MTPSTHKLLTLLQTFAAKLTDVYALPISCNPEDQLKGPVGTLVEGTGARLGLAVVTATEIQEKEIFGLSLIHI